MGKRKSRMSKMLVTTKKAVPKLEMAFSCPFCDHGSVVECRIDLKHMIAVASCFVCLSETEPAPADTSPAVTAPTQIITTPPYPCKTATKIKC
uniref:Transcription elongation factor 1 homolog n=1 Tax=Oryza punctata TaxID=4537 RepID=A0A0E0LSE1_ORYPU